GCAARLEQRADLVERLADLGFHVGRFVFRALAGDRQQPFSFGEDGGRVTDVGGGGAFGLGGPGGWGGLGGGRRRWRFVGGRWPGGGEGRGREKIAAGEVLSGFWLVVHECKSP